MSASVSSSSSQMKYWTWMKRCAAARSALRRPNFSCPVGKISARSAVSDAEAVLAGHRVAQTLHERAAVGLPKAPVGGRVAREERLQHGLHLREVVLHPLLLLGDRRPVAAGDEVEDHAEHGHEQERERPGERVRRLAVLHDERDHDVQPQDEVRHPDPPGHEAEPLHACLTLSRPVSIPRTRADVGSTVTGWSRKDIALGPPREDEWLHRDRLMTGCRRSGAPPSAA